jgi:hypothetical protein
MLPFTKRPGRDESGDEDLVTKDDLVAPAATASPSKGSARAKFPSLNDEEMTTLMASKSIGDAVRASVRPAAGAPPPSRAGASSAPGASPSSRPGKFAAQDDDDDGRTVVRGAPKIVKRGGASAAGGNKMGMPTAPTTISPAAVIKATLESARAGVKPRTGGDHLMAGPPQDLLEDLADRASADRDRHPADVGAEHTAILKSPSVAPPGMIQGVKALSTQMLQPQPLPHGTIPPGSARPMSVPPPPNSHPSSQSGGYATQSGGYATQSGGYAAQSGGYAAQSGGYAAQMNGPVPSGSVSVPGVAMSASMPAHFMVPQPPYSDGRVDPPGTAVTARSKAAGRPAASWALALAAFGIFVGVGAVAVTRGNADGLTETSASFVDPSRAGAGKAAAAQAAAAQASPAVTATPTGVPVASDPPSVGVPPVAIPAAAGAGAAAPAVATAPGAAPPAATAPAVTAPSTPPVAVAAQPAAPAAVTAPAKPAAAPVVAAAPQPRPAPVAAAPVARQARPAPAPAAEEPAAAAPKPAKPAKGGKGGGEVDDETKKALDELQKAQLERSF